MTKKRREGFMEVADSMGLTFHPDGSEELLSQLGDFKLFNQGRAPQDEELDSRR